MKTDALFYELFKLDPRSLFELLSLNMEGDYVFESITVKTTEKRFDGFLKRADGQGAIVFIEIQGYDDPGIYWRLFREICTWYEQSDNDAPFVAIALFINENHKNKRQSPEFVPQWKSEIESLKLPENKTTLLEELLEYSILQRFPKLTLMEVQHPPANIEISSKLPGRAGCKTHQRTEGIVKKTESEYKILTHDVGHLVIFDRSPKKSWKKKRFVMEKRFQEHSITVWGM